MKLAILFSGGKDSVYATYLAKKFGHEIVCLISIESSNKDSFMFHTPSISKTKKQAEVMDLPLIVQKTDGEKEIELKDLEKALVRAKKEFGIQGVVTGAVKSVYQASRIQKICFELELECFNPLWQRDEKEYLKELIRSDFEIVLVGVFAYPFSKSFLLRKIDLDFFNEIKKLNQKYGISFVGEGGEFETFVLNCPLFSKPLKIVSSEIKEEGENSFRAEVKLE